MPTGVVTDFSEDRGLGTVTGDDGATYLFHAVEIADGSRTIEVGCAVTFEPLPKFGQIQAARIRPA